MTDYSSRDYTRRDLEHELARRDQLAAVLAQQLDTVADKLDAVARVNLKPVESRPVRYGATLLRVELSGMHLPDELDLGGGS